MATTKSLLFGRHRERGIALVAGFASVVAAALLLAMVFQTNSPDHPIAALLTEYAVPVLLMYAPAPIAAAGAYARCGGPACLAVGVVPGVLFGLVGLAASGFVGVGDGSVLGLSVAFSIAGFTSAFVGYCAGVFFVLVADLFRSGTS